MIRIAICDDDHSDMEKIYSAVKEFAQSREDLFQVDCYENSGSLCYDVDEGKRFDIILLDIEMPGLTGTDLAGRFRKILPDVYLIFISSHEKYVFDTFVFRPYRFIPKEELYPRLRQALNGILEEYKHDNSRFIVVKDGREMERVSFSRIVTITKSGKYALFTVRSGYDEAGKPIYRTLRVREPLKTVLEQLPEDEFEVVNQVICNLSHISRIVDDTVVMCDNTVYRMPRGRIRQLKEKFLGYCIKTVKGDGAQDA